MERCTILIVLLAGCAGAVGEPEAPPTARSVAQEASGCPPPNGPEPPKRDSSVHGALGPVRLVLVPHGNASSWAFCLGGILDLPAPHGTIHVVSQLEPTEAWDRNVSFPDRGTQVEEWFGVAGGAGRFVLGFEALQPSYTLRHRSEALVEPLAGEGVRIWVWNGGPQSDAYPDDDHLP